MPNKLTEKTQKFLDFFSNLYIYYNIFFFKFPTLDRLFQNMEGTLAIPADYSLPFGYNKKIGVFKPLLFF